ncbi:MAG: acetyl-CoA carboxylase biotin carboxyl carrier protein subunit [Bacteroidota bacterium]
MDKKFKVKVNNSSEFNLSQKQIDGLDIIPENNSKFHILIDNQAFKANLVQSDFYKKKYTVVVNSNTYQIEIANPIDQLIKEMGYSVGSSKKLNFINAPMPGILIDINVKEGDQVKEGDTLLILEAMKMENAIICPKEAIVKSVFAVKGETVEKGKLLIELE